MPSFFCLHQHCPKGKWGQHSGSRADKEENWAFLSCRQPPFPGHPNLCCNGDKVLEGHWLLGVATRQSHRCTGLSSSSLSPPSLCGLQTEAGGGHWRAVCGKGTSYYWQTKEPGADEKTEGKCLQEWKSKERRAWEMGQGEKHTVETSDMG